MACMLVQSGIDAGAEWYRYWCRVVLLVQSGKDVGVE